MAGAYTTLQALTGLRNKANNYGESFRSYGKVLNTRGLGTPKTRLDAMIQSGELTDPLKDFLKTSAPLLMMF